MDGFDITSDKIYIYLRDKDDNSFVALATSIQSNTVVTKLCFVNGQNPIVSIDGWKVLFQILQSNKTIQKIYFRDCQLNFEWVQLFATIVLFNNNTLKELSFECCTEIGMKGVSTIVDTLCIKPNGCTLTSLTFNGVIKKGSFDKDVDTGTKLAELFVTLLQQKSTKLKELNLQDNCLGDYFIESFCHGLKYNPSLDILNLAGNDLTYYGASELESILYFNQSLVDLDVSYNNMGEGVKEITTALRYHPTLKRLVVECNQYEDIIPETIEFLKYNEVLETLSWDHGSVERVLDDNDTESLLALFDYNDTIHVLQLDVDSLDDLEFEHIDPLLEKNRCGERTASKKGLLRRQEMYMWLYKEWISKCHKTTMKKRLLVAEHEESSKKIHL